MASMNKRLSYTAKFKVSVIDYANKHGVVEAAEHYGIKDKGMIRRWKKAENKIREMPSTKRANRGKREAWPELENELSTWVRSERNKGAQVSTIRIIREARKIARSLQLDDFLGTPHWCHSFMERKNLTVRRATSVGQSLPLDWEKKVADYHLFFQRATAGISQKDIGNMDEVPVAFDMPAARTVDIRGTQNVSIVTTGAEKANFTVVLCVLADGRKCQPMVIFKRKTLPKGPFHGNVIVKANDKGWMNESLMKEWIEEVWLQRPYASTQQGRSALILDAAPSHRTELTKQYLQQHSRMIMIPGGLTKLLQPLDISVNKSFKSNLRRCWEDWMIEEERHTYTRSGKRQRPSYEEICDWIATSWDQVTSECIMNGFRKARECSGPHSADDSMEDLRSTLDGLVFVDDENFDGFDE
ncbi:DDE superfamily endonuclease [Teladorsagia circumcincta]|uniref:DDE superfamily endonuclease n=1 Tax=Teladorsagia circumcincta TaxID=45464 RepID=A0A2G9UMS9_TELCI|nr:DDE superfamily endonuclease [Teladorsagia circumcincta]